MTSKRKWKAITEREVPDGLRWDVLGHDEGQIVTRSYGKFGRAEAGSGELYRQTYDASDRSTVVERRVCCSDSYCWGHASA